MRFVWSLFRLVVRCRIWYFSKIGLKSGVVLLCQDWSWNFDYNIWNISIYLGLFEIWCGIIDILCYQTFPYRAATNRKWSPISTLCHSRWFQIHLLQTGARLEEQNYKTWHSTRTEVFETFFGQNVASKFQHFSHF